MIKELAVFICLIGFTATFAQSPFTPGIRTGMIVSTLTDLDAQPKTAYYLGAQFPIRLSRLYTLQPEVSYIRLGAKNTDIWKARADSWGESLDNLEKEDVNISYIDFILMNKIHWRKFNVYAGAGVSLLAGGNKYSDYNYDLTLNFGFGYRLTHHLDIETRFRYGLIDIVSYKEGEFSPVYSNYYIQNLSLQLGLVYSF